MRNTLGNITKQTHNITHFLKYFMETKEDVLGFGVRPGNPKKPSPCRGEHADSAKKEVSYGIQTTNLILLGATTMLLPPS